MDTSSRIVEILESVMSQDAINQVGRETGQCVRLRVVTPCRLFMAIVAAFCSGNTETIADLHRTFNFLSEEDVAYKAFYNQLAKSNFALFMREMVIEMLSAFAIKALQPAPDSPLLEFEDILIQDGSSYAIKAVLANVFPGRFTNTEPAAVELHATMSGFSDEVCAVYLTPDKEAERPFLPRPEEVAKKLLLADRGYPSIEYFDDVRIAGGFFIMRLSTAYKPYVTAVHLAGKAKMLRRPIRLQEFLAQNQNRSLDLDVEFERGKKRYSFRLLVLPGKEKAMTKLCTNLSRDKFSLDLVGKLYRFRWQVELVFKEWKSYANLRKFNTGNRYITEGFIWGSLAIAVLKRFLAHAVQLASAVIPMSTRRVAMCASLFMAELLRAIQQSHRQLVAVVGKMMGYLLGNAKRAHPQRDLKTGRMNIGLEVCLDGLKG